MVIICFWLELSINPYIKNTTFIYNFYNTKRLQKEYKLYIKIDIIEQKINIIYHFIQLYDEYKKNTMKIQTLNVRIPEKIVLWLDSLIENGIYKSRSEAIRDYIRKYLEEKAR